MDSVNRLPKLGQLGLRNNNVGLNENGECQLERFQQPALSTCPCGRQLSSLKCFPRSTPLWGSWACCGKNLHEGIHRVVVVDPIANEVGRDDKAEQPNSEQYVKRRFPCRSEPRFLNARDLDTPPAFHCFKARDQLPTGRPTPLPAPPSSRAECRRPGISLVRNCREDCRQAQVSASRRKRRCAPLR